MAILSLIVAMDQHGLIGAPEGLPWKLSRDLRRFRRLTMGKPILMGRTTHEAIGRVLDGRTNVVLTGNSDYQSEGCLVCHGPGDCLEKLAEQEEIFIIGGAQVYSAFLPRCQRLYVTILQGSFAGDTHFPLEDLHKPQWSIVQNEEHHDLAEDNPHPHWFLIAERAEESGAPIPYLKKTVD